MSKIPDDSTAERSTYRRRTMMGALAAGASMGALSSEARGEVRTQTDDETPDIEWLPSTASEAHVAVLSGYQADVGTNASGCAHVLPGVDEYTLLIDLVLEDIQCVTQAHIHEGGRDETGPIVAPLLEYTEELDGSGDGDPLTTTPDMPLIEGVTIDDPDLVESILDDPSEYYINVHTAHNPEGEIRGQIRGFALGQETEIEPVPAEFTVSNLDPDDATVVRGDRTDVSARIRNIGDVTDTQTVELRIDGEVVAERELELGCRRSRTVRFEDVDTEDLEPDEYEHEIFTEDDSETGSLRILRPAEFRVSDLDPVDVTVTRGDLIDVSATIENVGEVSDRQTIEFRIDDDTVDDQQLELDGEESETVTFEDIDTEDFEPNEYEHGIFTEDDSETGTLTVQLSSEFTVSDLEPQDVTLAQGDLIDVSATIENVGQWTGTQTVEFRIDDETIDDLELELDEGESETVTFEDADTEDLDPGEYEHGIFTDDDSETGTLTVEEPEDIYSIDSCTVIDEPGEYEIVNDIDGEAQEYDDLSEPACIWIRSSDVILEGNGYTISGEGDEVGIKVGAPQEEVDRIDNVEIRNLQVDNCWDGIEIGDDNEWETEALLEDVVSTENSNIGIVLPVANGSELRNVTSSRNGGSGALLWETSDVTFNDVTLSENDRYGLDLADNALDCEFVDLTVTENDDRGITIEQDSGRNTFSECYVADNGGGGFAALDSLTTTVEETTVENNGGVGLSADSASFDLEAVAVRDNDDWQVESGDSFAQFTATELEIGDSAEFEFSEENLSLDAVEQDDLPGLSDDLVAVGDGVDIENIDEVDAILTYDEDNVEGDEVGLWRYDGDEWILVDSFDADGTIEAELSEDGIYAPVEDRSEEEVENGDEDDEEETDEDVDNGEEEENGDENDEDDVDDDEDDDVDDDEDDDFDEDDDDDFDEDDDEDDDVDDDDVDDDDVDDDDVDDDDDEVDNGNDENGDDENGNNDSDSEDDSMTENDA